jgi:outer membrane lipoprotein-sorting protein
MSFWRYDLARAVAAVSIFAGIATVAISAQQPDESLIIQHIDASAKARFETIAGYTVTEHYTVYRGSDEVHPAAEMTVRTTYRKGVGKNYEILSQSGSEMIRKLVFRPLLDNEKSVNEPDKVSNSWFTSANYQMHLKPGGIQRLDGRDCLVLSITPRHKAPNMVEGSLWVDARDNLLVQIEGIASKSPSIWTGATHMMRRYFILNGFSMTSHSRAESSSFLFGRTVLTIDYQDYKVQFNPAK